MRAAWLLIAAALVGACRPEEFGDDGPVIAPDAAEVGTRVRLATFNVRRFFDTVCDAGVCGPDEYEELPSQLEFDQRADQLALAIAAIDADVIALEEVESQACIDALLARLTDSMPYGVIGETGDVSSVDVAILSKRPIESFVGHRDMLTRPDGTTTQFARELLEVHTRASQGTPIIMFAAHFKSKSNDDPGRRLAEGQASSRIVNEVAAAAEPGTLVVMGGDLNDRPGSPALNALTVEGQLIRVADDLPLAQQSTYTYHGTGESIDHLLLAPTAASLRRPRSAKVWRDSGGWGGSDHSALSAEFLLPDP